ncbi:MAG: PEP-utilizing enzyme [Candidatus Micrarchaeota archaeon]
MEVYKPTGIKWVWAHRRNMALTQAELFSEGLKGEGYFPAVRFSRHNYLAAFTPGDGAYIFYDEQELRRNTKAFQEDISTGRCTQKKLSALSNKFFKKVNNASLAFGGANLRKLGGAELLGLFRDFRKAMAIGPIITVQLWGIECCWNPRFELSKFLTAKFSEWNETDRYQECVETLSASREKSVPFRERESFLGIASRIQMNGEVQKAFYLDSPIRIEQAFEKYPKLKREFDRHITDYAWTTSEYMSVPWTRSQWIEAFRRDLRRNCKEELSDLLLGYRVALAKKRKLLRRLKPPKKILRILDVLEEFTNQRDWAKGKYSEAYLNWQPLIAELARRMDCSKEEATFHSLDEIELFLQKGEIVPPAEIEKRKKGYIAISHGRPFKIYSGNKETILREEGIYWQFASSGKASLLHGIVGCGGLATGKARVVKTPAERDLVKEGEILVTYMTTMEFTPLFRKVAAIVTDEGGLSSHAAIVSREFRLPCIVGTKNATKVFKTGDMIEVDGINGTVRRIKQ